MKALFVFILIFIVGIDISYSQSGWLQKNMGTGDLVSVNFINSTTGFMFRSDKYLLKSTNGGQNWSEIFINIGNPPVKNGMFIDEEIGICLLGIGTVINTTNGGNSWTIASLPQNGMLFLQKVVMTSKTTGFASGADVNIDLPVDGVIFKTTNGGNNWTSSYPGGFDYHDVKFIDENTGYACWGSLTKSTDGGLNWTYVSGAFRAMYELSQIFADTFYIACDSGYVLKTINSGVNWVFQSTGIHNSFNDIFFLDNQNGYVVGDSGNIFRTSNGGLNWTIQNSGTNKKLNELWFINKDTGFIAGDSGLLLVTYNGGVTSLSQNYQFIPEKFQLHQNYPNPFNPETVIRFSLKDQSFVRLIIYNILGQEIETLVSDVRDKGNYTVAFNSKNRNLSSGIYYYKLEVFNNNYQVFSSIKRMVLIK